MKILVTSYNYIQYSINTGRLIAMNQVNHPWYCISMYICISHLIPILFHWHSMKSSCVPVLTMAHLHVLAIELFPARATSGIRISTVIHPRFEWRTMGIHWLSINGTLEELTKVSKVKILPILISIHSWVLNYWKDHNDTSYVNWAQWIDPIRSSFKIRCKGLLLQYHVILQSHHIIRSIGVGYPFSCVFMRQRDKTNNKPFQLSIIVNYWLFQ